MGGRIWKRNKKANDGDDGTHWSNAPALASIDNPHWLQLTWDAPQTIQTVKIHWERCNATAYSLQTSDDGNSWSDLADFSTAPSDFRQTIELDNAVTTRYLRINVTSFNPTAPTESGGSITYNTVGVCEFETYSYAGILETQDVMTAEDVANDLTV